MSPHRRPIAEDWYHLSFDSLYPIVYEHRTVMAARPESLFSIDQTQLSPTDRVLDLACGGGRHMAHLLHITPHVVGLDYSTHLIELAQQSLGPDAKLVRADMRHQPFAAGFDVVMNYFTSFGYFQTQEENLNVVEGIATALKPGGRFFIDFLNRNWTLANLQADTRREAGGFEIRERRWIDHDHHRINKSTIVSKNGRNVKDADESVQLYTLKEFTELLTAGGLHIERTYGNYDGAPFGDEHPRMIVVGTRAGS